MIETDDVSVNFGRIPILRNLSARFPTGRFTAMVGPNGCGKSTLMKAMMGFLPLRGGRVLLDGADIHKIGRKTLARRIAFLPQECHCPDYMTLGELVELSGYARYSLAGGPSAQDRKLFQEALEVVGLADRAGDQVNSLSGGQRQRAWIAMVLAQDTNIILMDEPVNHLDMKYQYAILGLIRDLVDKRGKTVIAVLHDINLTAGFADDAIMMTAGTVVASGPVQSTITTDTIAQVFDLQTDIFSRNGHIVCLPHVSAREHRRQSKLLTI
jgi:iron complex transport system ATP-binding protein